MKKIRWIIEFILFKIFTIPLIIIPRKIKHFSGSTIALIFYYISAKHRNITLKNLSIAFPDKNLKERRLLAKNTFLYFGKMLVDVISFRRINNKNLNKFTSSIDGVEHLKAAHAKNKGVICMTAHFGNWELLSLTTSLLGFNLAVIARKSDNPLLEKELHKNRIAAGGKVFYKQNAFRKMRSHLKEGNAVGILIDQNQIDKEGIFVDFFGLMASTTPSLAMLSIKYDIPVVPTYAIPEKNGKYRIVYYKELKIKKTGDFKEDVKTLTQKATTQIENIIREHPPYWLWMHKRWNTRPLGEDKVY